MFSPEPIFREVCRLMGPPGHVRPRRDPVLRLELRVRPPELLPPTEPLPLLTPTAAIPLTGRGGRLRRAPRALRAPRREAGQGTGAFLAFVVLLAGLVVLAVTSFSGGSFSDLRGDVCEQRPTLCQPTPAPAPAP